MLGHWVLHQDRGYDPQQVRTFFLNSLDLLFLPLLYALTETQYPVQHANKILQSIRPEQEQLLIIG